ncbi:MAG: CDP-glycerol glycerophosphotransferase family protein [Candidatus Harrisonbacteria bacterium]|nr:CDP-glycerol glycerophosphotransferase family protein [Candidatus Harrisonbacteria bacterium]
MKTIFLFVPPSLISDLLRTPYLKHAAEKFRVIVFTRTVDQETGEREYLKSPNVIYHRWKTHNSKLLGRFKFFRIDGIHQFNYLRGVAQYYQKNIFLSDRRARLIRFLTRPFGKILTTDFFTTVEKFLIKVPREFRDAVKKYQPSAVAVSTPGMTVFEAEAILMAKRLGVPTAAVNFNWDNLTLQKAHLMRRCDFLLVWNDIIKEQAIKIHKYHPNKVMATGVMRFDHYFQKGKEEISRDEFLKTKGLNPNLKTILIITESKNYSFQLKWFRKLFELRERGSIPYANVFIRIHPHDTPEAYKEFSGLPDVNVELAGQPMVNQADRIEMRVSDLENQKLTIKHTDINFNYCSTMSLESMIFDKPVVIFYEPGHYDTEKTHFKPILDVGSAKLVRSPEELALTIKQYLTNPGLDREKRKLVLDRYMPFRDGQSPKRSVEALAKILK